MQIALRVLEIECTDPITLGRFWSAALGSPIGPGSDGVHIKFPGNIPQFLYLVEERDSARPRNRTRIWLNPLQGSLAEEIERLTKLGATVIERRWRHKEYGLGVVILTDPEGNEFCVESSDREVAEVRALMEED
ncbi:VOC family protein [Streptomyces sp. NPDC088358]|uniref:VOC family protein n=1 Tax=Streptomyces sp. NPDC088358 TaxID=3365857 RepID=UPI00381103A8